jgi:hypothetical protein
VLARSLQLSWKKTQPENHRADFKNHVSTYMSLGPCGALQTRRIQTCSGCSGSSLGTTEFHLVTGNNSRSIKQKISPTPHPKLDQSIDEVFYSTFFLNKYIVKLF